MICSIIYTEKQLPAVDLQYYVLPPSQLEPLARNKHVQERASIPDERKLLFVKAITISLGVPEFHQDLVRQYFSSVAVTS